MEFIKTLDVDLDLDDVSCLYDYARCEYIHRPVGSDWDLDALQARAADRHVDQQSETFQSRLKMMDQALLEGRFLEKVVKDKERPEESRKGDNEQYFGSPNELQPLEKLPKRVLPIYYPGDLVKGHVTLELKDKMQADHLRLTFKGRAQVRIRVYLANSFYDDYGEEVYVDKKETFWEKSSDKGGDMADQFALLSASAPRRSAYIPEGLHRFPFEYVIPEDAPGSIPDVCNSHCNYGYLTYRLKACIDMGNTLNWGNIVSIRGIWVEKRIDIARNPQDMIPFTAEEKLNTGFLVSSGKVLLRATLPRKAFVRGEVIPIIIDVENTCGQPIASINASVHWAGKFRSGTGALRPCHSVSIKSVKVKSEPIPANSVQRVSLQCPLDFSDSFMDGNLIPVGTLDDCSLLDCRYEVIIKAKRKGPHRDMEIRLPITMGSLNSDQKNI